MNDNIDKQRFDAGAEPEGKILGDRQTPIKITKASKITRPLVELFLFLVWLIASASLVWFVARYGITHPLWDKWQNVPYLTGDVPLDWQKLWAP
jgi:hypothetical protein